LSDSSISISELKNGYGKRESERQIKAGLFERIMMGKQTIPINNQQIQKEIADTLKDSYVFEFLILPVKMFYSFLHCRLTLFYSTGSFIVRSSKKKLQYYCSA
jgi:predicted nuclease of restriction endonuclease-like (RecB) superfamily